jgi:hypothetical protein
MRLQTLCVYQGSKGSTFLAVSKSVHILLSKTPDPARGIVAWSLMPITRCYRTTKKVNRESHSSITRLKSVGWPCCCRPLLCERTLGRHLWALKEIARLGFPSSRTTNELDDREGMSEWASEAWVKRSKMEVEGDAAQRTEESGDVRRNGDQSLTLSASKCLSHSLPNTRTLESELCGGVFSNPVALETTRANL